MLSLTHPVIVPAGDVANPPVDPAAPLAAATDTAADADLPGLGEMSRWWFRGTVTTAALAALAATATRLTGHPAAANLLLAAAPLALAVYQAKVIRVQADAIQQMTRAHNALLDVLVSSVTELPDTPEDMLAGPARRRSR